METHVQRKYQGVNAKSAKENVFNACIKVSARKVPKFVRMERLQDTQIMNVAIASTTTIAKSEILLEVMARLFAIMNTSKNIPTMNVCTV